MARSKAPKKGIESDPAIDQLPNMEDAPSVEEIDLDAELDDLDVVDDASDDE